MAAAIALALPEDDDPRILSDRERKEAARRRHRAEIARLRVLASNGKLTDHQIQAAATVLGCDRKTIRRHLDAGVPDYQWPHYALTDEDRELYVAEGGSAAAVWRARKQAGKHKPSLSTLQRAFRRELSSTEKTDAKGGPKGRKTGQLYLHRATLHRNERWEGDHWQCKLPVLPPRHTKPVYPWVTWWIDDYSRAITGWAVSIVAATSAEVLASIRRGVEIDPDDGPFGGVPYTLLTDNGREYKAKAVKEATLSLGAQLVRHKPFMPEHKGKIERLHRTVNEEFLRGKPGWKRGPKQVNGRVYKERCWTLERFVAELGEWIRHYNTERPHRALGRKTPLEVWSADPTPLRLADPQVTKRLTLAFTTRKVQKDGVHFEGLTFFSPGLYGLVNETVDVGHVPHDRRKIEIYRNGMHVCTCEPQDAVTDAEREKLFALRSEDSERISKLRSDARRRQRIRLASATDKAPVEEITIVSEREARRERRSPSDAALRRAASTDLLNLDEPEAA